MRRPAAACGRNARLTRVLAALARLWAPSQAGRRGTCSRTAPFSTMRHGAAPRCLHHCSAQQLCFALTPLPVPQLKGPDGNLLHQIRNRQDGKFELTLPTPVRAGDCCRLA